jgi:hypothetical protein
VTTPTQGGYSPAVIYVGQCPTCQATDRDNHRIIGLKPESDGLYRRESLIRCDDQWHYAASYLATIVPHVPDSNGSTVECIHCGVSGTHRVCDDCFSSSGASSGGAS